MKEANESPESSWLCVFSYFSYYKQIAIARFDRVRCDLYQCLLSYVKPKRDVQIPKAEAKVVVNVTSTLVRLSPDK